jgi:hypothetical protein
VLPMLRSRDLVAIHAACTGVTHMSGAVEQNNQIREDEEDTTVLTHDGSMGDLLTSLNTHVFSNRRTSVDLDMGRKLSWPMKSSVVELPNGFSFCW